MTEYEAYKEILKFIESDKYCESHNSNKAELLLFFLTNELRMLPPKSEAEDFLYYEPGFEDKIKNIYKWD
jgi:hypothetical protein